MSSFYYQYCEHSCFLSRRISELWMPYFSIFITSSWICFNLTSNLNPQITYCPHRNSILQGNLSDKMHSFPMLENIVKLHSRNSAILVLMIADILTIYRSFFGIFCQIRIIWLFSSDFQILILIWNFASLFVYFL